MRTDEEELLVQSIRAGTVRHRNILIVPATIDQLYRAAKTYKQAYDRSVKSGLMTEQGLEMWMIENTLLPKSFVKFVSINLIILFRSHAAAAFSKSIISIPMYAKIW